MNLFAVLSPWLRALARAAAAFNRKNGWVMSSHIAMSMMLALFPFVLFTVALSGAAASLLSQDVAIEDLVDLVFGGWPEEVSKPILNELFAVLETSSTQLATLGGVLALYFASNGVNAVRVAMVNAYGDNDPRPFWKARLICAGLVVLGGAGILVAALFEVVLPLYVRYIADLLPYQLVGPGWERGFSGVLLFLLPLVAVLLCHILLPGQRHRVSQILPGAVLTVVLWWAAGIGFAIYVGSFAQYSATYAGLAGAMAAMIFLYVNAAILIFGAEFNGALVRLDQPGAEVAEASGDSYVE
ncbi:YihY/virulence factor BrkB family protein [Phaeobacter gallaeciensis]|uniref:YihY/virulence factor BrkB family protein n=1 Tax=Phaeobacter gallaeciensis TaxID=60890 RepID=UPI00238064D7|nr:YihY/virulence factor BrkB family protein [Phaeobacter gallaeciensis]MDE4272792.1 YihY/virulence factor BrkB family protein [Phaeobacter gallaeciensis]MDE4298255.1 YihY/virulence factor BrkB family protein [Phaeobacter gallaeciensis]MDE5183443.1 YihY/virulence factor BrkB family protein [Phaeobacter gallaeciensis]